MEILLYALAGLVLLVAVVGLFLYRRAKRYLHESQEGVEGTMSGIMDEIEDYQQKTQ